MDYRFPSSCRLHSRREFDFVWKCGRKIHLSHFLIVVLQKNCGPTRLGLTVSRKIGGAVVRNRVKRLLREYFRLSYHSLPSSVDIVIVARNRAADLSLVRIAEELNILKITQTLQV